MKCYKCGCDPIVSKRSFHTIDPIGLKPRRWSCENCLTEAQKAAVDPFFRDLEALLEANPPYGQ